jgi:predicted dehydrogenase
VSSMLRPASGARVVLEASRVAVGEQNSYGFEIHGTRGAVRWDLRRMNELAVSLGEAYQDQPVSTLDAMARSAETGTWVEVATT